MLRSAAGRRVDGFGKKEAGWLSDRNLSVGAENGVDRGSEIPVGFLRESVPIVNGADELDRLKGLAIPEGQPLYNTQTYAGYKMKRVGK
jgi:hypothetical protein